MRPVFIYLSYLCLCVRSAFCDKPSCESGDATSLLQTYVKSSSGRSATNKRWPNSWGSYNQNKSWANQGNLWADDSQGNSWDNSEFSLPTFATHADLRQKTNSKWAIYLKLLYGPMLHEPSVYPIDVSKFGVLSQKHLSAAGLDVPIGLCPKKELDVFSEWEWTQRDLVHIHHSPPFDPLPHDMWVEVTHCEPDTSKAQWEDNGYWMYYAPGSGVFYNMGKTKVFADHQDAVSQFLPGTVCEHSECTQHFAEMVAEAAKHYTSLQFSSHQNGGFQMCNLPSFEILDLHHSGNNACSLPIAGGFGHCSCACKEHVEYGHGVTKEMSGCLTCDLDCSQDSSTGKGKSSLLPEGLLPTRNFTAQQEPHSQREDVDADVDAGSALRDRATHPRYNSDGTPQMRDQARQKIWEAEGGQDQATQRHYNNDGGDADLDAGAEIQDETTESLDKSGTAYAQDEARQTRSGSGNADGVFDVQQELKDLSWIIHHRYNGAQPSANGDAVADAAADVPSVMISET